MDVAMGGRVAEEIIFGKDKVTTGKHTFPPSGILCPCWDFWSNTCVFGFLINFCDLFAGASSDFDAATNIATAMVKKYGMSEIVSMLLFFSLDHSICISGWRQGFLWPGAWYVRFHQWNGWRGDQTLAIGGSRNVEIRVFLVCFSFLEWECTWFSEVLLETKIIKNLKKNNEARLKITCYLGMSIYIFFQTGVLRKSSQHSVKARKRA